MYQNRECRESVLAFISKMLSKSVYHEICFYPKDMHGGANSKHVSTLTIVIIMST